MPSDSFAFSFRDGARVPESPAPRDTAALLPSEGATGAKFERGTLRRLEEPAIAGPMANGPLAVISTEGRGPDPLASPQLRPFPLGDPGMVLAAGSYRAMDQLGYSSTSNHYPPI